MEFSYNASAVAAGGILKLWNGRTVVVPSLASVALSPTGGEGTTTVRNYHSDELSFSFAESQVRGTEVSPGVFATWTNVCITNLRVLDVLSIAALEATVRSTRSVDPLDDDHEFELDASYHGVEVIGAARRCTVVPSINVSMKDAKRYQHVSKLVANNPAIANLFDGTPQQLTAALGDKRPVLGSLVETVAHPPTDITMHVPGKPHKLVIPGVGVVRFGELMLKPGRRRLNLLRIKLGVDGDRELNDGAQPFPGEIEDPTTAGTYEGGSLTFGSSEGNGSPLWP